MKKTKFTTNEELDKMKDEEFIEITYKELEGYVVYKIGREALEEYRKKLRSQYHKDGE